MKHCYAQPPAWFEERSCAEIGCSLQLLKARVSIARPLKGAECAPAGKQPLSEYSMGSIVASRMLQVAEEAAEEERECLISSGAVLSPAQHDPRRFLIGPRRDAPCIALTLVGTYVALFTNHAWAADALGCTEEEALDSTVDALKVLFTEDAAAFALSDGEAQPSWICLPSDECARVLKNLYWSSQVLPPLARKVGSLNIGYFAIAPTWE